MAGAQVLSTNTASGILKEYYLAGIQNQVNNPNAFFSELEKSSRDIIEGKYAVVALRMSLSQAVGSIAELGTLPTAQNTAVVQAQIKLAYIYGVIRVSGPFMEQSKTDKGSFIRGLRSESEGITDALKLDLNRQIYGDSTGALGTASSVAGTYVVTMAAGTNMLYFEINMLIDIVNTSGSIISNGTARTVLAVDPVGLTITLDSGGGAITITGSEVVVRSGCYKNEINGLGNIVDNVSTLHTITPSTSGNNRWAAIVNTNFGSFGLAGFQSAIDQVHDASGEWINMILSQAGPRNAYLAQLQATRQFVTQEAPKKLNGGFTGLAYTGGGREAVWVKDPYAPGNTIFGVTMEMLEFRRTKDFEFIEINGSAWLPDIYGSTGADAYKAVLATYGNIICKKRNAHLKLQGVTA